MSAGVGGAQSGLPEGQEMRIYLNDPMPTETDDSGLWTRYGSETCGLAQEASWLQSTHFNLMNSNQHRLRSCSHQGEREITGYQLLQMHILSASNLEKSYGPRLLHPVSCLLIV